MYINDVYASTYHDYLPESVCTSCGFAPTPPSPELRLFSTVLLLDGGDAFRGDDNALKVLLFCGRPGDVGPP